MAVNKGTHSPKPHTRQDFPEAKGKIVDIVEVITESDYHCIAIRFQDRTALTFTVEPCVFTFPVYADWAGSEEKVITGYPPVRSWVPTT